MFGHKQTNIMQGSRAPKLKTALHVTATVVTSLVQVCWYFSAEGAACSRAILLEKYRWRGRESLLQTVTCGLTW